VSLEVGGTKEVECRKDSRFLSLVEQLHFPVLGIAGCGFASYSLFKAFGPFWPLVDSGDPYSYDVHATGSRIHALKNNIRSCIAAHRSYLLELFR